MRLPPLVLLLLFSSGCFLDPTCQDECDGDGISRCSYDCPSTNDPCRLGQCEQNRSRDACGDGLTCVRGLASNSPEGSSGTPTCVDAALIPCDFDVAEAECAGPNAISRCVETTTGGVRFTEDGFCDATPGSECHEVDNGITCVSSPKERCDPTTPAVCQADGVTLLRCDGRGDDFAVLRVSCSPGCVPGSDVCGL